MPAHETDGVDAAVAHELLAAPLRRVALADLADRRSGQATLAALATSLSDHFPERGRRELLTLLHHVHLPKLAAAGVVDYDHDRATVRYVGEPTVERYLTDDEGSV